ncbi:hypothetical protein EDB81DRAFT_858253 [Dactylonectria macrodidyma]|uniref:Uncharacterized protein n=1 Tax=Dactylonectria macrodidyma TaxID=307937 RepID=A0A9P9EE19_9HYPO|nr:hypothetical protein EDB81DRAFT_862375 [Dactylonectria macrodidyma]KAH7137709.1 hypothetical protein EDB81DRAFT_858253 [Dactylonectria macrodidyma]
MYHNENQMEKRCGQCLTYLNPGPKLRRLNSEFLLCDACGDLQSLEGHLMVRQYDWEGDCAICYEEDITVVFLACWNGSSPTLVGHTLCYTCAHGLGIYRTGSALLLPEQPVKCPYCVREVIHAVQAASEVVVLDEPEVVAVLKVLLTQRGQQQVKARLMDLNEIWMDLQELGETQQRVAVQMFENKYGI